MTRTIAIRRYEAGFTLIEMLVSLTVVGMVSSVLMIGIGRMDLRQRLLGLKDAQIDEIADAQFALRRRIAHTYPSLNPQTGNSIDFTGTPRGVEFDGEPPGNGAPDSLQRYRLRLERNGDLMLYRLNSLTDSIDKRDPAVLGWTATRLISGAGALSIRYFGPQPDLTGRLRTQAAAQFTANAGPAWQENWTNRNVLPVLVRLTLDFPAGDKRTWPDLVVRLRAANGDNCARDRLTNKCTGAE